MTNQDDQTTHIQALIDRLMKGDESAREELINCTWNRLLRLTRKMLADFPDVHRWEQTEDVFQKASLRLWKALGKVKLNDARHFLRLAAEKIRFELIDLARHYYGPQGQGAHHASQPKWRGDGSSRPSPLERAASTEDPSRLAEWAEIHRQISALPDGEREVFDLLWYNDLTQEKASEIIGVDVRTVKRRWRRAKLTLQKMLQEEPLS